MSNSYQVRPWRALTGWAWWLLCQPSPPVSSATHQELRESSLVSKRREPNMWVAEGGWWWLCRPSPPVSSPPHQELGESSLVSKRGEPNMWVAEFTSQVAC